MALMRDEIMFPVLEKNSYNAYVICSVKGHVCNMRKKVKIGLHLCYVLEKYLHLIVCFTYGVM